nr:hypothetical protein [Clostridia bacterium]
MDITRYKVTTIQYAHGEYRLGNPVEIVDEGSFYRIDGTHIFDKFKILSMELVNNQLTIHMKDKDVILTVVEK